MSRIIINIAAFVCLLFAGLAYVSAQTTKGGNIKQDARWDFLGSPYLITGDIIIYPNATLTIDPGVRILLNPGVNIFVNGRIIANGNASQLITFTANPAQFETKLWGAIKLNTKDTNFISQLHYCIVEFGGAAGTGPIIHGGGASHEITSTMIFSSKKNGIELGFDKISRDMILTASWTPYFSNNHLEISESANLKLLPGVTIKMAHLKNIFVKGSLSAVGNQNNMITITSMTDDETGLTDTDGRGNSIGSTSPWGGVSFAKGSNYNASILEYCNFKYGGGSVTTKNGLCHLSDSSPKIQGCEFSNSVYHGIVCEGSSSPDLGGGFRGSIGKNIFSGFAKSKYALVIYGGIDVLAMNNCWGNGVITDIEAMISDGSDSKNRGVVAFLPFADICKLELAKSPALVYPDEDANNIPIELKLVWQKTKFAEYYRVEVSEKLDFSKLKFYKAGISDTSYSLPSLDNLKTYFWRVRAENEIGPGAWSEIRSFLTIDSGSPGISVLEKPLNGQSGLKCEIEFEWTEAEKSTVYHLQVSKNSFFTDITHDYSDIYDTKYKLTSFPAIGAFYWRIRAGNGSEWGEWSEVFTFTTIECPKLPPPMDWQVTSQTGENTTIIIRAGIGNIPGKGNLEPGDAIGVFYQTNGILACGGMVVWKNDVNTPIAVWGDNYLTSEIKDGFDRGEPFRFVLWDASIGKEIVLSAKYESGSDYFIPDSITIVSFFEPLESADIYLKGKKFQYVSSYMSPFNPNMQDLLPENVTGVKNSSEFLFHSHKGINRMKDWDYKQGYCIYSEQDDIINITGFTAPANNTLDLDEGWHILPFLSNTSMSPQQAFASISNEVLALINSEGQIYSPKNQINQIESINPGEAVFAYIEGNAKLLQPSLPVIPSEDYQSSTTAFYKPAYSSTGSVSILIIESEDFSEGDEIGVLNSAGTVIGSSVAYNGKAFITVWGDNDLTDVIDGAALDESLSLRLYHSNVESKLTLLSVYNLITKNYESAQIRFAENSLKFVKVQKDNGNSVYNSVEDISLEISPNPAMEYVNIYFDSDLNELFDISIFDIYGHQVWNKTNYSMGNGASHLQISLESIASGNYYIRFTSSNEIAVKPLKIIR